MTNSNIVSTVRHAFAEMYGKHGDLSKPFTIVEIEQLRKRLLADLEQDKEY